MFFKKLINKGYEADQCQVCHNPFKMIKFDRIHKCKRCLKFICSNCGDAKQYIIDEEGHKTNQKHRICTKCKSDIQLINNTLQKYQMNWQKDSKLSRQWLLNMRKDKHKDYEYHHFLKLFHHSRDKFAQQNQIIQKDVIRGRTDFSVFNYSMKQFFYTIQQKVDYQQTTRCNIANVLYGVAARFDKVGYCQGMSGIAAFLLCFASEESSYIIFCDLLENIFPPCFFERSSFGVALIGLLAEIYFLKEYYQHYLLKQKQQLLIKEGTPEYTQDELSHIKMVIQLAGTKSLLSIFIGVLNFTNLIFVWEELKRTRSFQVVQKAFLAIIYLNRKNILQQRSFKKLEQYFQNLDTQWFQQTYHDIQIDQQMKKILIQQFYMENTKKWSSAKSGNAYTLSKVTKLTQQQIKLLQTYFCGSFTNEQLVTKPMISEEIFMKLIEIYYTVLKHESEEGESILEISPYFLKKIFTSYLSNNNTSLILRQFICCFSICTKSALKDRICAIITTFQDNQGYISRFNFCKLITSLTVLAPSELNNNKMNFMERTNRYFQKNGKITIHELQILLNDEFINEMTLFICSQCKDIIKLIINNYDQYVKSKKVLLALSIEESKSLLGDSVSQSNKPLGAN